MENYLDYFLLPVRSKDASYLGKILEGFTLAQKPLKEKTVRSFKISDHVSSSVPGHTPHVSVSLCRSSRLPVCLAIIVQSIISVLRSMFRIFPGSAPRWPRLSGCPKATWSKRSPSKQDATSWTLARGGRCWERTPCKVRDG